MKTNQNVRFAWKVVRPSCSEKRSFISSTDNHHVARYRVGEWTTPPQFGHPFLFVFETRQQARDFKKKRAEKLCYTYRIFRCEVNEVLPDSYNWAGAMGYLPTAFPKGTMTARAVKLVKPE